MSTFRRFLSQLLAFVLILTIPAAAMGTERGTGLETGLWWIPVAIEKLDDNAKKIGLSEKAINNRVGLKLRSMGYTPLDWERTFSTYECMIYVNTLVVGPAFHIDVEFKRFVEYEDANHRKRYSTVATTWKEGITGTHGGDRAYMLSALEELLDTLLNQYLKANGPPPREENEAEKLLKQFLRGKGPFK